MHVAQKSCTLYCGFICRLQMTKKQISYSLSTFVLSVFVNMIILKGILTKLSKMWIQTFVIVFVMSKKKKKEHLREGGRGGKLWGMSWMQIHT